MFRFRTSFSTGAWRQIDLFPDAPSANGVNDFFANSILHSNICDGRFRPNNFNNLRFFQLGRMVSFTARPNFWMVFYSVRAAFVATLFHGVSYVVAIISQKQMFGIATSRVVAFVQNEQPNRDWPAILLIRKAVKQHPLRAKFSKLYAYVALFHRGFCARIPTAALLHN